MPYTTLGQVSSFQGANGSNNGTSIAKAPDGTTWIAAHDPATFAGITFKRVDGVGVEVPVTAGATIPFSGSNTAADAKRSLFIDGQGYAHILYVDRHDQTLNYRRGTPVAGGWTWSGFQPIRADTLASDGGDLVVTREGTGWVVHIVYSHRTSSIVRCNYRSVAITSAGVMNLSGVTTLNGTDHTGMQDARPTIDFHHTGDGVSTKNADPRLFVTWNGGSGAAPGIRIRHATYAAGVWTWGTERAVSTSRYCDGAYEWVQGLWDGDRWIVGFQARTATADKAWYVYERYNDGTAMPDVHALDTVITSGEANDIGGGFTYDGVGNLWFFGKHRGTTDYRSRKWDRATATLASVWTTLPSAGGFPSQGTSYLGIKRGTLGGTIEAVYVDNTSSPYDLSYSSASVNVAPNAPALDFPVSVTINRGVSNRFEWTFSDPDGGDFQSQYSLRYRPVGVTSWTTVTAMTLNTFRDFPADTFMATDYEWQVQVQDQQGLPSPWSPIGMFTAQEPPTGPTITSPAAGSIIGQESKTVTWSVPAQDAYEVRRVDDNAGAPGTTVYWTSGTVTSATARSMVVAFPTNNRYEHVQVRVQDEGLWTGWATARVQVSYTPPAQPVVTVVGVDLAGIGTHHALNITVADGGGATAAANVDVWVRDPSTAEELQIASGEPLGTWTWHNPAGGIEYEIRVTAHGSNGTSVEGQWTAIDPLRFYGVLLHDPQDPDTLLHLRYNVDGAVDELKVEGSVVHYQGRELPSVEFGDGQQRTVTVPKVQIKSRDAAEALRALVLRRAVLCYRDSRGRKLFGVILESTLTDVFYGYESAVPFTVTEYGGLA